MDLGFVTASRLTDKLGVSASTVYKWIKRDKIDVAHYRYVEGMGRGGRQLEIDPAGLPEPYRQQYVMAQIGAGAWDVPGAGEINSAAWKAAPGYAQDEALRRLRLLDAFSHLQGRALRRACDRHREQHPDEACSYASWRRWKAAAEEGGAAGPLPGWGRRTRETVVHPDDYERYAALYLTTDRRTARKCYEMVRGGALREGRGAEDFPCARTVQNLLEGRESEDYIELMRWGLERWKQRRSGYAERDWTGVEAGHVWIADHRQLDVFVACEETGEVGRPWMTVWMDARSWKILSYEVYLGHPNSDRVHLTFKHAAQAHGLCREVYIDNGKDFRCLDFAGGRVRRGRDRASEVELETRTRAVLDVLGISCTFATPYNARAKTIERRFQAFIERLEKFLLGYAGSRPERRPQATTDRLKEGDVMPLAELREHFDWYAAHINGRAMQGKIHAGRTPNEVWSAERGVVRKIKAEHLGMLCLRTTRPRQIRRCQFKMTPFDRNYRADWMLRPDMAGVRCFARYDPEDDSMIWLYRADGVFLGTAAPKPTMHPMISLIDDPEERGREYAKLQKEIAMQRAYERDLLLRRQELRRAHPDADTLREWADAARAYEEFRRETGRGAPIERGGPDRVEYREDERAAEWLRKARRQQEEGLRALPFDPDDLEGAEGPEEDDEYWFLPTEEQYRAMKAQKQHSDDGPDEDDENSAGDSSEAEDEGKP